MAWKIFPHFGPFVRFPMDSHHKNTMMQTFKDFVVVRLGVKQVFTRCMLICITFYVFRQLNLSCWPVCVQYSNPKSTTYNHMQYTALCSSICLVVQCIYDNIVIIYHQCTIDQCLVWYFIDVKKKILPPSDPFVFCSKMNTSFTESKILDSPVQLCYLSQRPY